MDLTRILHDLYSELEQIEQDIQEFCARTNDAPSRSWTQPNWVRELDILRVTEVDFDQRQGDSGRSWLLQ
jgi:hypothetical protein